VSAVSVLGDARSVVGRRVALMAPARTQSPPSETGNRSGGQGWPARSSTLRFPSSWRSARARQARQGVDLGYASRVVDFLNREARHANNPQPITNVEWQALLRR
jgi:hypothetical protein